MFDETYCESFGGNCCNNFKCDKCDYGGLCLFCSNNSEGICLISNQDIQNVVIKKCKKFDESDTSTCY